MIPVGCPTRPADTFLSQAGEIKEVDFGKLVWSDQQRAEIERSFLEMEVGPRFRRGPRGRRLLNLAHWAKYYSTLMQIAYDSDRNLFAWTDPIGGPPVWHSEDDSLRMLAELLQVAAKSCDGEFPEGELRPVRV